MPDNGAVQEALERIVASVGFANSPRMSRFLRFVVEETVSGRAGDLKEYVVGLRVFDRPESFDPTVDPTVRVEASKLRAKLNSVLRDRRPTRLPHNRDPEGPLQGNIPHARGPEHWPAVCGGGFCRVCGSCQRDCPARRVPRAGSE